MPLISVIIPVYNGEKTIRETIDSVLNQTFQDFELIVINDGSQDTTVEIVEGIQDPRLKLFSYPNAGQAMSRNRGFSHAVGEYISFLDADDLWTPDKLDAQLKALQENPQAAVAYSWTNYIDESGQYLRQGSYVKVSGDVFKNLLVVNFLENGSNPLIRAKALAEVGGFDGSLTAAEDWDMWLRLAARYHFVAVPSPQILYRVSATSSSANVSKLEAGCLPAIERAFSQVPSLDYLKPTCLANIYKYLTYKALEGFPERNRGLVAVKFLWNAASNDPSLFGRRIIWKVLLKIAIVVILPPQAARNLLTRLNRIANLDSLLLRTKLEAF
jgi:glycosyltransferase involved in cell wall biosynthesis